MKTIKIKFVDFWPGFNERENVFVLLLSASYLVELSDDPEYLFFSCFGTVHLQFDCIKVFFTGENLVPDFTFADYGIGFHYIEFADRYLRFPLYMLNHLSADLLEHKHADQAHTNRRFCNFVYSNGSWSDPVRVEFFKLLSKYKPVDSGGALLNNLGYKVSDKLDFLRNYKFTIAFENSSSPGYTTEKIVDAMIANTVPIYWGNPLIELEFNKRSFIDVRSYASLADAVEHVRYLDSDDIAYMNVLSEPWVLEGSLGREMIELGMGRLQAFLAAIILNPDRRVTHTFQSRFLASRMQLGEAVERVLEQSGRSPWSLTARIVDELKIPSFIVLHGALSQNALENILGQVTAIIAHQRVTTGCLTRIPEMLMAGIPIFCNTNAVRSWHNVPGIHVYESFPELMTLFTNEHAVASPPRSQGAHGDRFVKIVTELSSR